MDTPTNGNDFLIGDDTAEIIHALAGNDVIDGKGGNDQIFGEEGDDTIRFSGGWRDADTVDGGADVDTLDFQFVDFSLMPGGEPGDIATGHIYVDLAAGNFGASVNFSPSGNFFASIATVTNVENVIGSSGNDFISGNASDNVFEGGAGNDTMSGGDGNDTFRIYGAYFDADKIDGGNFADTLDASEVNYISLAPEDYTTFSFGAIIDLSGGKLGGFYKYTTPDGSLAFGATTATIAGIEHVIGSAGDDLITGNRFSNNIEGGAGNDTMSGGRGRDVFRFSGAYMDADVVDGGNDPASADFDVLDFSAVDLTSLQGTLGEGSIAYLNVDLTAGQFGGVLEYDAGDAFIRFGNAATVKEIENVIGSAFDDRIKGSTGANRLEGGDGDDLIDGGEGADTLLGGKGNDIYRYTDTRAVIIESADEGTDLVQAFSRTVTLADNVENLEINGRSRGVSTAIGNAEANIITALLASDLHRGSFELSGGAGNDTLYGNSQADTLDGGTGNDTMAGGAGNDEYTVDSLGDTVIEGEGDGIDTIVALNVNGYVLGADVENLLIGVTQGFAPLTVFTGTGNGGDNAMAGVGKDVSFALYGLEGADQLRGANLAAFGDLLDGGAGNDKLYGQAGTDTLRGGAGNDHLDGGTGTDTADYSLASSGIIVDMTKAIEGLGGEALGDNFVSIENVTGSEYGDIITGNSATNVLKGGKGDDIIRGGGGKDVLLGEDGNDTMFVDRLDIIDGGAGRDMVFADSSTVAAGFNFNLAGTNAEYVSGNAGKDTFNASTNTGSDYHLEFLGNAGNDTLLGGSGLEYFWGGQGADTFIFSGNRADYAITTDVDLGPWAGWTYIEKIGDAGGDWLMSVETLQFADQTISAPDAYVQYNGTAGANIRIGSDVRDEMYGGAGNDTLSGGGGTDILNGGAGADTLSGGDGNDALFIDNADIVSGGEGYDTVYADDSQGPLGLNFTVGSTGIEAVWGGRGSDVIDASTAPAFAPSLGVSLYGNAGNDTLIGSTFLDLIEGGLGDDTLTGGLGEDSFIFNLNGPGGGRDTITDFEDGADTLDIWDPSTSAYLGYADVTVADSAEGAVITYSNGEIVLAGILASQIDQNDFVL